MIERKDGLIFISEAEGETKWDTQLNTKFAIERTIRGTIWLWYTSFVLFFTSFFICFLFFILFQIKGLPNSIIRTVRCTLFQFTCSVFVFECCKSLLLKFDKFVFLPLHFWHAGTHLFFTFRQFQIIEGYFWKFITLNG